MSTQDIDVCPGCRGDGLKRGVPVAGMGEMLEAWKDVFSGPVGHWIDIPGPDGVVTYRTDEVCGNCVAMYSKADLSGYAGIIKPQPWYASTRTLKAAGDAIIAGYTQDEAAEQIGVDRATLQRQLHDQAEKYLQKKDFCAHLGLRKHE